MTLPANRAFVEYRHNAQGAPCNPYRDCTAGWYWTVFHAADPVEVYREAEARDAVDQVFEDAGIDWPESSPSNR